MTAQVTNPWVFAVMEEAQSRLFGLSATASDIEVHDRMIEARDAVAQLIAAAKDTLAQVSPDGIGWYRLRAAIRGMETNP